MYKKLIVCGICFQLMASQAFAAASCGCVMSAAASNAAKVSAAIAASTSSLIATLQTLLRDNKGMNVAQAVRESQATATQDTANLAKQITEVMNGHQANLIAYNQREVMYQATQKAAETFSAVTAQECAENLAKQTASAARSAQAAYSAAGGNTGRTASGGKTSSGTPRTQSAVAQELYVAQKSDPRSMDAGIVLRPGCTPQMSSETAYADKLKVIGGYQCTSDQGVTIPAADAKKASEFVARLIVPNPAPTLPDEVKNTPSGALYEAEMSKVRARQSYLLDVSQDSLSRFQASRDIANGKAFFAQMGITAPDKVSEMDYLRFQLISRFDNPKYQEYEKSRNQEDLLRDLQETLTLIAAMQYRQLEISERMIIPQIQFFESQQDSISRPKLEALRSKAGS